MAVTGLLQGDNAAVVASRYEQCEDFYREMERARVIQASNQEDMTMDWIERLLGISPDGGDGSTEMLYFVAVGAIVALILGRSFFVRHARKRGG